MRFFFVFFFNVYLIWHYIDTAFLLTDGSMTVWLMNSSNYVVISDNWNHNSLSVNNWMLTFHLNRN
ncbi:hypothetical protein BpHYR1_020994 [Brachionus plicatilis]|uniref:Uncharacterized protein n=1 Tax=Brachionus plicatilis TaxID=10195 RepID=A0A3M7T1I8_BRAPC|nr:hypothetical protein BpHYR1_020994 [Brachionus plicatilis]